MAVGRVITQQDRRARGVGDIEAVFNRHGIIRDEEVLITVVVVVERDDTATLTRVAGISGIGGNLSEYIVSKVLEEARWGAIDSMRLPGGSVIDHPATW